jgi:hypothetical protein
VSPAAITGLGCSFMFVYPKDCGVGALTRVGGIVSIEW